MPLSPEQQQREAERLVAQRQREEQKAAESAARQAHKTEQTQVEAGYRAQGMTPWTGADGNLYPDPLFEQKQAEKARKEQEKAAKEAADLAAKQQRADLTRKGIRHAINPVDGTPIPLESEQAVEQRRKDAAEKLRKQQIDDQIKAAEAEHGAKVAAYEAQGIKPLTEKGLAKAKNDALFALQSHYQAKAKGTDKQGWWDVVNNNATPEAKAAQEALTRLQSPDAELTDDDLATLEANDATKPLVDKYRKIQELQKFHAEHGTRLADLILHRDAPDKWAESVRTRRAQLPPEQLKAELETSRADLEARSQALQDQASKLNGAVAAHQLELDTLSQQAAARRSQGIPAGEIVSYQNEDGTTEHWPHDLAVKREAVVAKLQDTQAQQADSWAHLQIQQEELKRDLDLHNEAAANEEQRTRNEQQSFIQSLKANPRTATAGQALEALDLERQTKLADLQSTGIDAGPEALQAIEQDYQTRAKVILETAQKAGQERADVARAATIAYQRDGFAADLNQSLPKVGLDPQNPEHVAAWNDARLRDFSDRPLTARRDLPLPQARGIDFSAILSDGSLVIHPAFTFDPQRYAEAVEKSGATPEAQAAAMEELPQKQLAQAAAMLPMLKSVQQIPGIPSFKKWQDATKPKGTEPEQAKAYLDFMQSRGFWQKLPDTIARNFLAGLSDIGTQTVGTLGALTGSQSLSEAAASWSADAQRLTSPLEAEGANSSLPAAVLGQTARMAGPMAAMLLVTRGLGGGIGTASAIAATQTAGSQYADSYNTLREQGMSHADAWKQTAPYALASGLVTSVLTAAGGKTGIEAALKSASGKQAAKGFWRHAIANIPKQAGAEIAEELPDELFSQVSQAYAEGKRSPQQIAEVIGDFWQSSPALIGSIALLGGAGGAVESYQETRNQEPGTQNPLPANLPETVAAAEAAIDSFADPNLDEATVARTQDAARGVLYIAQGTPLTDLDADTLAALDIVEDPQKPGTFINGRIVPNAKVQEYPAGMAPTTNPDGTPGMGRPVRVKLVDGQPVISQQTLDNLETKMPAVRAAIPLNEKDRITQLASPSPNSANNAGKMAEGQNQGHRGNNPGSAPETGSNATTSPVQAPAGQGHETPRSQQAPAQSGSPVAQGAGVSQPPSGSDSTPSSLSPSHDQRAAELATVLEDRKVPAHHALPIARAIVAQQGIVGASAEEQFTRTPEGSAITHVDDILNRQFGYVRGTGRNYSQVDPSKAPAASPTDPFTPAASTAASTAASSLTDGMVVAKQKAMKAVPVQHRARFQKFYTELDKTLTRYAPAFPGGVRFVDNAEGGIKGTGAGIQVADASTNPALEIDLAELFASSTVTDAKGLAAFVKRAVLHEIRHIAALKVITKQQARDLWAALTPKLKNRVYASYYAVDIHIAINEAEGRVISDDPKKDTSRKITAKEALAIANWKTNSDPTKTVRNPVNLKAADKLPKADAFHMAHEFLRMLDEDAEFAGQTSEAMDASPALGQAILDFLTSVIDQIKKLIDTELDATTRVSVKELQKLVEGARKKLLAGLPPPDKTYKGAPPPNLAAATDNRASVLSGQPGTRNQEPSTAFKPVLGSVGTAFTDSNDAIEFQWAVVDVNSLNVSNDDTGRINPGYPQDLQPRDRTSAASEAQVNDIAKNFNLDRLSASSSVGDGAPITGPDAVVESGNGRIMGARRAHTTSNPSAKSYRDALIRRAAEFGLNAEQVEAVPNPVLIRIRRTDVNRTAFVLAANVSTIAPKREMEQAKIDSKQIVPDLFDSFVPSENGDIFTAANADFIRAFVSQVIPPAERGQVIDASGNLSQSGLRRIRNALFVHAYGTSPEALNALGRLTESIEATDVNLARALLAMAPRFAEQNARIANGTLYPLSITENLAQALQKLSDLRNRGQSIESWLQEDRIPGIGDDPGPVTTELVKFLHANRQRPRQILDALDRYAKALDGAGDPHQMSMFGDEKPTQETLWKLAANYKEPALAMGSKRVDATAEKVDFNREMLAAKIDQDRFVGPNWYYSTLKKLRKALAMGQPVSIENREVSDYGGTLAAIVNGEEMPLTRRKVPHRDMHFHFGVQKRQKAEATPRPTSKSPTPGWMVVMPDDYNIVGYTPRTNNRFENQPIYSNGATRITEEEALAQGIAKERFPYGSATNTGHALAYVEKEPQQLPSIPPKAALKLYRTLTAKQDAGTQLTAGQSQALEKAERSLGQTFLFDTPNKTLKPAEDLVLEQQTASRATFADSTPEQLRLFMGTKIPRSLPSHSKLLEPTATPDGTLLKHSATLPPNHPLVQSRLLPAGQITRKQLHAAIIRHFTDGATPQQNPVCIFSAGGGAAGKSTLLAQLERDGQIPSDHVKVNADDIKVLIPEYDEIISYNDGRAASVVHEESSLLAKKLAQAAVIGRYHIVYDATMARPAKSIKLIDRMRAAGYEVNMLALTIDLQTAIARARQRGLDTNRFLPDHILLEDHGAFNAAALEYLQHVHHFLLYESANDRAGDLLLQAKDGNVQRERDDVRTTLAARADEARRLLGSSSEVAESGSRQGSAAEEGKDSRGVEGRLAAYQAAALDNLKKSSRTAAGVLDTSASAGKAAQMAVTDGATAARRAVENFKQALRFVWHQRGRTFSSPQVLQRFMDGVARLINRKITKDGVLLRDADSAKFPYTRIAALEAARTQFAADLLQRLNDPAADPVETAAWVHWRLNFTDHPYADGVGKTTEVLADWILMRAGHELPQMPARDAWFSHARKGMPPADPALPSSYLHGFSAFLDFYRSLFPSSTAQQELTRLFKASTRPGITPETAAERAFRSRDMLGQSRWLQQVARLAGFQDADDLARTDPNRLAAFARLWRDQHPRGIPVDSAASGEERLAKGRTAVDDGPDLFSFNTGLGLDTLLTPGQKESKLQQSQTLDLFGGKPNDGITSTGAQPGSQRREPPRRPSRPPAPPQQSQGSESLLGDLFSFGDDGQRISASRFPGKRGDGDERTGSGDVGDGVSGPTDQGATDKSANSPAGDPPGLPAAPAVIPQPENPADRNHRIDAGRNVAPKGNKAKLEANFAAMKLLRELEQQGRNPTPEEKRVLAAYTGWGWIKEAFNTIRAQKYAEMRQTAESYIASKPRWEYRRFDKWQDYYTHFGTEDHERILSWADTYLETHERLKAELSDKEFHAAEKSTLNAHFTTPSIIDAMWKAVGKLGFKGGRAMEPGGGIGHFIGVQPENLAQRTHWEATELDDVTARILAKLYPQARVNSAMAAPNREVSGMGFQNARIPNNSLDLFISNVPFAKQGPGKAKSEFGMDFNLHNYFFARALAKVKPGGLVAFITTANTMEASRAQRDYLNNHGQLVAAVRLPNTAFKENAGTEVTTDILILRKPDDSDFVGEPWRERVKVGEDIVTSKRGKGERGAAYQRLDDWLGQIDPEWIPADAALVEPFQAWVKGGRPATGQKRKALESALQNLHGPLAKSLDFRAPIYVNEYFARHPENVLGSHRLVGSMYGPGEYTVTPSAEPLDSQLESFVDRLPADIMNQDATNAFEAKAAERGDKVDSYVERDGRIFQVTKEGLEPVEWQPMPGMDTKAKAAAERKVTIFRQWAKLRDAAVALVKLEANPAADEAEMKNARLLLNQVYDRTVERFGPISKRRNNNYRFLEDDPEAPLLAALEDEERTTTTDGKVIYTYHKADIFRRRLIEPQEAPTKADTLEEAVSISMAWEGTLNPQYVADLLGIDASLARQKLIEGGHAFEDPSSGLLMTADEYLSGPVSERLRLAQEAAKDSPQYERNVTALKAALPPHKAISEASIILGQRWIPDSIYTAFLRSIGVEEGEVKFSRELNSFEVRGEGSNEEWNVGSKGAKEIFDAVVNNQTLNYYGYVRGEGMKLDPELTATLHVKADEMRDAFSAFVKTTEQTVADPEYEGGSIAIPDLAERDFNQKVNGIKPPNYVGDWVKLPGQSGIIWLKPFRRAVLARLITQGRGMMAHGVGSGKTYNQIALAMELRRLGKARKPVIVVQNSTINQFAASFRKAYPQAKILVATPRSYNAQTRARFTARMATGDWDAIILTHSNIDLIPHSQETVSAYFARELEELDAALLASDGSDQQSDLQKARDKLVEKRDEMMAALGERQDDVLNWEDIGVDALIVDEAHAFKNAPVVTNRGRDIKNIPSSGVGSQRAVSMMMKTRSVRERNNQKGVFFATGTPVSNSMAEAFIMLRYIAPDMLEANGIRNFDDFASQYGDVVSQAEATWDGKVKNVDRFAKFVNGQQLINLVRSVFDVAMGNESLGIDVPTVKGGKPRQVIVPATAANMTFNNWVLNEVSPAWARIGRKDLKDNPQLGAVPIMTMQAGIAAALDPRLIHDNAPDDPNSKVNTALREVIRIYKAGTERKTAQVIFSDLFNSFNMDILEGFAGHPFEDLGDNRRTFNLGQDIRAKIIKAGIPEKEIMVVTDQKDEALTNIFDKVNDGDIRVIIGSTGRLGVGVNIQERLAAAHHLMPPRDFKPAMMEQRNGRIIRQGNLHAEWRDLAFVEAVERGGKTRIATKNEKGETLSPSKRAAAASAWLAENDKDGTIRAAADKAAREFDIEITEYGVEKSLDSAVYSMMAAKQGMIAQVLTADAVGNEFEDPSDEIRMSMAEMAAHTMGDPDMIRSVQVDKIFRELRAAYDGFQRMDSSRRADVRRLSHAVQMNTAALPRIDTEAQRYGNLWEANEGKPVLTFGGLTVNTAEKDAKITEPLNLWITENAREMALKGQQERTDTLVVNGQEFRITIRGEESPSEHDAGGVYGFVAIPRSDRYVSFTGGARGALMALRRLTESTGTRPAEVRAQLAQDTKKLAQLEAYLAKNPGFPRLEELQAIQRERLEIQQRINARNAPPPAPASASPVRQELTIPPLTQADPKLLTPEVKAALQRAVITDNSLVLPDQLDRKLYEKVNKALESAGGVWSKRDKAHLFAGDPRSSLGLIPAVDPAAALLSGRGGMIPLHSDTLAKASTTVLTDAEIDADLRELAGLVKQRKESYTPSSYDTAPSDPFTGIPSLITGSRLSREQGRAISHAHAQRLRAGLSSRRDSGQIGPALAADRAGILGVAAAGVPVPPVLSRAQFTKLLKLPQIGEGAEAIVYADRDRGTVYKVLAGHQISPTLGIWPQVYYTADGKLDYAYAPAEKPRQLAARLAVQTLIGGTPTEIVGISPDGHIILKQPLSPNAGIGREADGTYNAPLLNQARAAGAIVEIPRGLLADPTSPRVFLAFVEGRPWLLMDLHPDNFVGDNHGNARINDPVVGQLPGNLIAKIPGLAQLVKDAAARAKTLGDRSVRLFMASKRVESPSMASDSGAAQANEPSPGGLSEAEARRNGFVIGPLYRGETSGSGNLLNNPLGGIHFSVSEDYARGYATEENDTLHTALINPGQRVLDLRNVLNENDLLQRFISAGIDVDRLKYDPYPWSQARDAHEPKSVREIVREVSAERSDFSDFSPNEEITDALTFSRLSANHLDSIVFPEHGNPKNITWIVMRPAQVMLQRGGQYFPINPESSRAAGGTNDTLAKASTSLTSRFLSGAQNLTLNTLEGGFGAAAATAKATGLQAPLNRLGWNHLDRAVSAKLAAHTRWLRDPAARITSRTAENIAGSLVALWTGQKDPAPFLKAAHALKREFIPDSVLPREILAKKREMEVKTAMGSQRAMDLVRALSGNPKFSDIAYPKEFAENPVHRRNLYEAMTGERPMSSLPPEMQTLAHKLRAILVSIGQEAVKQGRMSVDTFDNLRGTYMPHFYKEDVQKEKSLFHKFRLGVRDILAQRTTAWHITDTSQKDANGDYRLVSHSGNQWRFRSPEHMNAFYEDFINQQALAELHTRYGKKFRTLTAADLMTPSKLDPEIRGRLQEIKRTLTDRFQRHKPLTIAEQEKAGLIMDPVYAIARYAAQMAHDNSTAEFFNTIAADKSLISAIATPGFTEIPDNPRFGRLAGQWVQADIANQVLEMIEAPNIALQIYDTLLGWWKTGKTVLNPGTHVRNVLGNLFFSQLAGNSVWNPGNATYYKQALQALRNGGPVLTEAYDQGVLGADFVSAELRQTLRQLLPDPATIVDDGKAGGLIMGIGKAIGKFIGNPANAAYNKAAALYQAEDEVFKLAAYLKAKAIFQQQGTKNEELSTMAAGHVRQWFPYFDSGSSGTLKLLGRTAMPFLGFYRESIRIFGHALKERPLALATGLAIPSIITMLSAMALGLDDDDLDEIKKDMRGKTGKLLGFVGLDGRPWFSMLLPVRSDTGQVQQFDISAVHPFVDFLGTRVEGGKQDGWWPSMFRSFVAAGPLGNLLYSNMTGEDAFFGSTIVEPNMTTGEAFAARASNAAKTLLPPLVPGGTGFGTLLNMGSRTTGKTLEVRSPAQAVLRTVGGLDVRNATPDLYRLADDWRREHGYEVQEGMDYGSTTPASRARSALFKVLAQDNPNPKALKNILAKLKEMGHPVRTEQDINRLLFYKDPMKLIGGNKAKNITATDAQAQFRSSLTGEARQALESALAEYQRIKQKAPSLIRAAQ